MRLIKILLATTEHGPFTEDQVRRYLMDGDLISSDLAIEAGDTEWVPLREVLNRPPKPESQPLPLDKMRTAKIGAPPLPPTQVRKQPSVPIPKVVVPKIVAQV